MIKVRRVVRFVVEASRVWWNYLDERMEIEDRIHSRGYGITPEDVVCLIDTPNSHPDTTGYYTAKLQQLKLDRRQAIRALRIVYLGK